MLLTLIVPQDPNTIRERSTGLVATNGQQHRTEDDRLQCGRLQVRVERSPQRRRQLDEKQSDVVVAAFTSFGILLLHPLNIFPIYYQSKSIYIIINQVQLINTNICY